MKRLGILFLVLVIALGGIGAAFAAWTDTVTITGTVNTGSVDLEVVRYSGTWVWKVPGFQPDEIVVWHGWADQLTDNTPANGQLIARAYMGPDGAVEEGVVGVAENIFPGVQFTADVLLHYAGSIPAIVYAQTVQSPTGDPELIAIMGWDYTGPTPRAIHDVAKLGTYDPATGVFTMTQQVNSYYGVQMHYCDYMLLEVNLLLPQEINGVPTDFLMDKSATWTVNMNAVQWNEAPPLPVW
jgi:predicted ribosomally synthesized peptide with SipW-like signal peptide